MVPARLREEMLDNKRLRGLPATPLMQRVTGIVFQLWGLQGLQVAADSATQPAGGEVTRDLSVVCTLG